MIINYRYCFGALITSYIADNFVFERGSQQELLTSINDHKLFIKYRQGQKSDSLSNYFNVYQTQLIKSESFTTHNDNVTWNGCRLYNKTEYPYVELNVFITKGIIKKPFIHEINNTTTLIIDESTSINDFMLFAKESKNFIFEFSDDFTISNVQKLITVGEQHIKVFDRTPYTLSDFSVTSLDYLEAFNRYLKYRLSNYEVLHMDTDQQVSNFSRILLVEVDGELTERGDSSSHIMYDDKLGAFMRVSAKLKLEFLSNDITYAQQFEHDFNSDLGLRTIQSFIIKEDYNDESEKPSEVLSTNGWSATCLWSDFVEFNPSTRTSSRTFQGSSLYCIPFSCELSFFIVKGTKELPSILNFILNTYINIGETNE